MSGILTPEEYATRHKQAFRSAFDYLNTHFPPKHDANWWGITSIDGSTEYAKHEDNRLLLYLLSAAVQYLEDETKLRKEETDEN